MKILIACCLLLTLTGCMYQRIDAGDIYTATKICESHGGINSINSWFVGSESAVCQDGANVDILVHKKVDLGK